MGLAIVKRLSQLLGHELTVRSRPGSGSVFRVWIERALAEPVEAFAVAAETVPGRDDARTVLLVDDEEAIRTSVSELLTEWGCEVLVAPTTADAVRLARERGGVIDVLISDLRLREGKDGLAHDRGGARGLRLRRAGAAGDGGHLAGTGAAGARERARGALQAGAAEGAAGGAAAGGVGGPLKARRPLEHVIP